MPRGIISASQLPLAAPLLRAGRILDCVDVSFVKKEVWRECAARYAFQEK